MDRKEPPEPVEEAGAETTEIKKRRRKAYRAHAERMNPSPFLPIYDSRGRLRHKPPHVALKV